MKRALSKRALLLIEMSILLLFFAVCAVICVNLFVGASNKNKQANQLNAAVIAASSIGDTIKSCGSNTEQAKKTLQASDPFVLYYNADWEQCKKKQAQYQASINILQKYNMLTAHITFTDIPKTRQIYQLTVKQFTGGGSNEQ